MNCPTCKRKLKTLNKQIYRNGKGSYTGSLTDYGCDSAGCSVTLIIVEKIAGS